MENLLIDREEAATVIGALAEPCTNCQAPLQGKFCHSCGARVFNQHDYSFKHFAGHSLHEITHLENSKIWGTFKALVFKPGYLTTEYFSGRQVRFLSPLRVFLVCFAAFLFMVSFDSSYSMYNYEEYLKQAELVRLEEKIAQQAANEGVTASVLYDRINSKWSKYVSVMQLGYVVLLGTLLHFLFWNRKSYFSRQLVFAMHLLSFAFLMGFLAWPVHYFSGAGYYSGSSLVIQAIRISVLTAYMYLALRHVYGQSKLITTLKTLTLLAGYMAIFMAIQMLTLFFATGPDGF